MDFEGISSRKCPNNGINFKKGIDIRLKNQSIFSTNRIRIWENFSKNLS